MKLIAKYNKYLLPGLVILFLISTTSSYFFIRKVLQDQLDESIFRTRMRIENYVSANKEVPFTNSLDDQKIYFEKITAPLADSGFKSATQFIPEQNKLHLSRKLVFQQLINKQWYRVTISEPLEGTRHLTILLVKIAFVTVFLTLIFLLIFNRYILSKIWQPFYQSLSVIKSFNVAAKDKLEFPLSDIHEFRMMNTHFNLAAESAVKDFRNLKEFSENASHEIQTPLAIIHSKLDLLMQEEELTEKQSELLRSALLSVNKLSVVQYSLLLLAKIDNRQFNQKIQIDLQQEVTAKIEQFHELWQTKGISFSGQINESIISSNKELLDVLLNNLFSNATRHNHKGGNIDITLANRFFEIKNTGICEPLNDERIFKRFYKEKINTESNGLGLSIVKEICDVSAMSVGYFYHDGQHCFLLRW